MLVFGFSLNMLTLLGLILAIGIVVDDAIVVVENVDRIMNEEHLSPYEATKKAMGSLSGALIAMSLVLCAVFVPVSFLGGKRQALAEHTAGAQLLQHSGDSLLIDADQGCLPPLHHAYGVASRAGEVVDHLVHPIAPLHRLKAVQHLLVILVPDVLKQGALFQFLWGQHRGRSLLLHISHFIITASVEKVKTVLRQIS